MNHDAVGSVVGSSRIAVTECKPAVPRRRFAFYVKGIPDGACGKERWKHRSEIDGFGVTERRGERTKFVLGERIAVKLTKQIKRGVELGTRDKTIDLVPDFWQEVPLSCSSQSATSAGEKCARRLHWRMMRNEDSMKETAVGVQDRMDEDVRARLREAH